MITILINYVTYITDFETTTYRHMKFLIVYSLDRKERYKVPLDIYTTCTLQSKPTEKVKVIDTRKMIKA